MIYVIGDSHVAFLSGLTHESIDPYPNVYDSNPVGYKIIRVHNMISAYALTENTENIKQILSNYTLTNDDIIVFSFGEVDLRFYIPKSIVNKIDPMIAFNASISSYRNFLLEMKKLFSNIIVFAPVPQLIKLDDLIDTVGFLDREVRNEYSLMYIKELKKICLELNVGIIDLQKYLMENENELPNDNYYLSDHIHLTCECRSFFELELKKIRG